MELIGISYFTVINCKCHLTFYSTFYWNGELWSLDRFMYETFAELFAFGEILFFFSLSLSQKVKEIESLKTCLSRTHVEQSKEPNQLNKQPSKEPTSVQQNSGEAQLIQILTEENRKLKLELSSAKARQMLI